MSLNMGEEGRGFLQLHPAFQNHFRAPTPVVLPYVLESACPCQPEVLLLSCIPSSKITNKRSKSPVFSQQMHSFYLQKHWDITHGANKLLGFVNRKKEYIFTF